MGLAELGRDEAAPLRIGPFPSLDTSSGSDRGLAPEGSCERLVPAPFWSSTGVSARSQRVSPKAPGRRFACPFPRPVEDRGSAEGPSGGISVLCFRARSRRRIPMNFPPQNTQAALALPREYPSSVHNFRFTNDTIPHQRAKKNHLRVRNSVAAGPEPRWIRTGDCTGGAPAAPVRRTRSAPAAHSRRMRGVCAAPARRTCGAPGARIGRKACAGPEVQGDRPASEADG